jgi:hypothetical protein
MRRSREDSNDEAGTSAPQTQRSQDHPALLRPALLSHVFKFVVRRHTDVKLLHVNSAWEDTAVNYCPWMWQRLTDLARLRRKELRLEHRASWYVQDA